MAISDMVSMGAKEEVSKKIGELESAEDSIAMDVSPKGSFSKGALNSLVKAHNSVTKLFGLPAYPMFEKDESVFPARFTKELLMIIKAVSDAIGKEVLTGDMEFSLDKVANDRDLAAITGKLSLLGKSKDFKSFLMEPAEEEPMEEVPAEVPAIQAPMSDGEMDKMFMGRM